MYCIVFIFIVFRNSISRFILGCLSRQCIKDTFFRLYIFIFYQEIAIPNFWILSFDERESIKLIHCMIEIPIGVSPLRAEVALKSTFDVPLAVAETLVKSPFQDW